jgi:putative ABC transport system permease protein
MSTGTFLLALRNLLRNRRRSLTTLLAMVIGLVAVLLFGGYVRDVKYALQTDFVRSSGHLQIQHRDYLRYGSGNPAAYGVADYARLIALVKSDSTLEPMLDVVTPVLQFGAIAGNFAAGVSRTVFVNGTTVADQNRMRQWNAHGVRLMSRPLTLAGTLPDSAVIGTGVARVLQLCKPLDVPDCEAPQATGPQPSGPALPDDIAALASGQADKPAAGNGPVRIEILATTARGAPNVGAVNVVRAEFMGIKELDDVYVGLHLEQAQRLIFGAQRPQVTAIAVQLKHTAQIPQARQRLEQLIAASGQPLAVVDYETLNPFYGQTVAMFDVIFGFMAVLIGGIVLFTVGTTMSTAVVERTVEIGTVRAIGLRRSGIRSLFVVEGLVLGVAGAVLGILAALAAAWAVNAMGLTWTPPARIDQVPLAVRVAQEPAMVAVSAAGLVIVAALSAIVPAARASRMNIVDALRHV